MSLIYQCDNCGASIEAEPSWIGHMVDCPSCQFKFELPMTAVIAGMVAADFWFQKSIGTGDIGEIFIVKKVKAQEKYFMKVLTPSVTQNLQIYNIFLSNISKAMKIDHPNINTTSQVGELNGHRFLLTPYIDGTCMTKLVEREAIKERTALKYMLKIARALRHAWDNNQLIHSNIKPSNIIIDKKNDPHLLDFGHAPQLMLTNLLFQQRPGYNGGRVADYMSPEHASNLEPDMRSDIYSLGASFFYMLKGARPFEGTNTQQILQMHLTQKTPDPGKEISIESKNLLKRMMSKNIAERYQDWSEVINEIKGILKKSATTHTNVVLKTQRVRPASFRDNAKNKDTKTNTNANTKPTSQNLVDPLQQPKSKLKPVHILIIVLAGLAVLLMFIFIIVAAVVSGDEEASIDQQDRQELYALNIDDYNIDS
jgi:serine/threonine protein kinase